MSTFTHKGYGRIYVETEADIAKVSEIIMELDEFEHGYMPANMVTVFANWPQVTYVHKFSDMDINKLTAECWKRGVKVFCYDAGHDDSRLIGMMA